MNAYSIEEVSEYPFTPFWKAAIVVIVLAFCVAGVMAEDAPKVGDVIPIANGTSADIEQTAQSANLPASGVKPGGVEVRIAEDGSPMFLVDMFAIDWKRFEKTKWYAIPKEFGRQVGSNTVENVKGNKGEWFAAAATTFLLATKPGQKITDDVVELFTGSDKDDGNKSNKAVASTPASASKPAPAVQVQGQGNSVTVPSANVDGSIVVGGVGNTVVVTEPAFQTAQ